MKERESGRTESPGTSGTANSSAGHRERLRQKYFKCGITAFHDYEAIELLLTYAIQRRDVKPVAKELFDRFKSLPGIVDATPEELASCSGLGMNSALLIKLIRDFSVAYLQQRIEKRDVFSSTSEFNAYARMKLAGNREECMLAVYLDSQNQVIDSEINAVGSVDYVSIYPRKLLERVIEVKASGLLLAHNHPSGNLSPSSNDLIMTKQIAGLMAPLGIHLRDHLIVTRSACFSLTRVPALMREEVFQ